MTEKASRRSGIFSNIVNMISFAAHEFRIWFLPLHTPSTGEEEEDDYEIKKSNSGRRFRASWWDDDDEEMDEDSEARRSSSRSTRRQLENDDSAENDFPILSENKLAVAPVIRPPEGGEHRMARNMLEAEIENLPPENQSAEDQSVMDIPADALSPETNTANQDMQETTENTIS